MTSIRSVASILGICTAAASCSPVAINEDRFGAVLGGDSSQTVELGVVLDSCSLMVNEDAPYACTPELKGGNSGAWSLTGATTCSWLSISPLTGELSGTPVNADVGNCFAEVQYAEVGLNSVKDSISIEVINVNDVPVISQSCLSSSNEDVAFSCSPLVTDPDVGDAHTWSLDGSNTCSWVNINPSTGQLTGTPNDDQVGACNIVFLVNDGTIDSTVETIAFSVNNVTPVLSISNPPSISEDTGLQVIRSNLDVQASDEGYGVYTLDGSATAPKCSDNGSVSVDASSGAVSFAPAANYSGTCQIKVLFDDQNPTGNTVTAEFSVTVNGINDPPVISQSCLTSSNEDVAFSCSPLVIDPDVGDTHTWLLDGTNTCSWIAIDSGTGQLTGVPNDDQVGSCTIAFIVNDGTVDSSLVSFPFSVANLTPTLSILNPPDVLENSGLQVIRADTDVQASDEGYGVYSIDPSATAPKCVDNGTVSINPSTGAVSYTPAGGYTGSCYVKVLFDDQNVAGTVSSEFLVTVVPSAIDAPPVISAISDYTTAMNSPLEFIFFTADEGGGPSEDAQTLSVVSISSSNQTLVPNANISYSFNDNGNGGNGEISMNPAIGETGSTTITLTVSDGNSTTDAVFDVAVFVPTDPPVAYSVSAATAQNTPVAVTLSASDPAAGDPILSWNIVTAPVNGSLSGTAPNLTYTPNFGFSGWDEFTYTAYDGETSNVAVVSVVVNGSAVFFVDNPASLGSGDSQVYSRIQALGFNVTLIDDNAAQTSDANGHDLVLISSSCASSNIDIKFRDVSVPVVTWERYIYDSMRMTATDAAPDAGTTNRRTINIVDPNHPLAAGLSGTIQVFTTNYQMVWALPTADAEIIANAGNGRNVLFVYEKGDAMYGGFTAPEKRVGYFLPDFGDGVLTSDGIKLIDAAMTEALAR